MDDSQLLFGFDPWSDWVALRREELLRLDSRTSSASDLEVARMWVGLQQRLIETKARLVIRPDHFVFDPDDEQPILEIERRAGQGRELNSFLSRRVRNPFQRDALLSDWGIHHLHLNLVLDASEFRLRSDRLLFVRVQPEGLYFIAVGNHESWSDVDLVEIIHANWPETIERYRILGWSAPRMAWSSEERQQLRNAGGQTLVSTRDGTTYAPIGGGYATDGSSLDLSFHLSQTRQYLLSLRNAVSESETEIREKCWAAGVNPDALLLRLLIEDEVPYAVDERHNVRLKLPQLAAQQGVEPGVGTTRFN